MKDWKKTLISDQATILRTVEVIDQGALQIAAVIDKDGKLKGVVTDGDIRRGLLKGISLSDSVEKIMIKTPITADSSKTREEILEIMRAKNIHQIPILDSEKKVVKIEFLEDFFNKTKLENIVVFMAGGLGSRLRPLTDDCPKPLLKVGEKPILETTLLHLQQQGFSKFRISVNYKQEMFVSHFGDGSRLNANIQYIQESKQLGTAGALGLLQEVPNKPIIVMNADLLTKINLQKALDFHSQNKSSITMCVREYDFQVPYGVVKLDKTKVLSIDEKPVHKFFVNGGIYVIEPDVLSYIPKDTHLDMTSLIDLVISKRHTVSAFPIREYWLDIGQMSDYARAINEYEHVFKK